MYPFFRLLFGRHASTFMDYKSKASNMSPEEIRGLYNRTSWCNIDRNTDISTVCLEKIESSIAGSRVLDIACGKGHLASRLAEKYRVTAADFIIPAENISALPGIDFQEVDICSLPFTDDEFDTVVCAHTLEHVPEIAQAVAELRRVCARRLIVVLPRQRPYRYTFDLHLHFFPYEYSFEFLLGETGVKGSCSLAGGDWFYCEDFPKPVKDSGHISQVADS